MAAKFNLIRSTFSMIWSKKNANTNKKNIESFNDSRSLRSYIVNAFIDTDLQQIWYGWYGNSILYAINDLNQLWSNLLVSHKPLMLSKSKSPLSPARCYVLSQNISGFLQIPNITTYKVTLLSLLTQKICKH